MRKKIIFIISLILVVIPFIYWNLGYNVGGDDSRLYYLFPYEYFKSFTFTIVSDNQLGSQGFYFPQLYISFFSLLILFFKTIFFFLNTQLLMYGLNLSLGFYFFVKILDLFIQGNEDKTIWVKVLSGLFYIFSIFTFSTLWTHQLFSVYFVSIFPLSLFLFIRALEDRKIELILLLSFVLTLFSCLLLSLPWGGAIVLGILPILFFLLTKYRKLFLQYAFILFICIFLLNLFWIIHIIIAPFVSHINIPDITSTITSTSFKEDNKNIINGVSSSNSIIFPLFNLFHMNFLQTYSSVLYPILRWNLYLMPFNLFFITVIVIAGILQSLHKNKGVNLSYLAGLGSLLLTLYLFTVRIGTWGNTFFIFLNNTIPGFGMFRNMYDKFGITLSFVFAFIFAISLHIVLQNISSKKWHNVIILLFFLIVLLNAKPFISGEYYKLPLSTTSNTYTSISDFNSDFYNLISYIKNINTNDKFLWLPLNIANYVIIQDSLKTNHYYIGVSPLQFLANKQDYNGKLSFPPDDSKVLFSDIENKNYDKIGKYLQKMNVGYIIVNHSITKDLQDSYLYGKVFYIQNNEFYKSLLGLKIKDFGKKYSLYLINPSYKSSTMFISETKSIFPVNNLRIKTEKIGHYTYKITLLDDIYNDYLTFLSPYHNGWAIKSYAGESKFYNSHQVGFNYANTWKINGKKGDIFYVFFKLEKLTKLASIVSILTFLCIFLYLVKQKLK
jgi:hypothetical protein